MKKPAKKAKRKLLLSVLLILLLLASGWLLLQSQQRQELSQADELIVYFIDVGQGDSIFIILPNGETMLIDAGESTASNTVINFITTAGTQTIDHIITTHPHSDHIGGMADVINAFEVKNIWMPDVTHTTRTFEKLLDTIEYNGLSISIAEAGVTILDEPTDSGNMRVEFLAPVSNDYDDLNNYSAVVLLTYGNISFLFMGDAEEESESDMLASRRNISADVIKLGHHGSSTSSTPEFISEVSPAYAIIS